MITLFTKADSCPTKEGRQAFLQGADAFLHSPHAHLGLWWNQTPRLEGHELSCIGQFQADNATSAERILKEAFAILKNNGFTKVVGPMNGNTWFTHRFVTEGYERAPFFLEPRNSRKYPTYFQDAGFSELSHYSSNLIDLENTCPTLEKTHQRLQKTGIHIRPINTTSFDEELRRIYEICIKSFQHNFLYTPLSESSFIEMYQKIQHVTDPEFVLLAEHDTKTVGFIFAIPDIEAYQQNEKPSLIVKTLAVLPERGFAGLGSALVDRVHTKAKSQGYTKSIHALQHENNSSLRISQRFNAKPFRKYTLYLKEI